MLFSWLHTELMELAQLLLREIKLASPSLMNYKLVVVVHDPSAALCCNIYDVSETNKKKKKKKKRVGSSLSHFV